MNQYIAQTYTAYGYAAKLPTEKILLGFNGEHPDLLTRLYILGSGYRAYAATLMRFMSPDTLSPFSHGGINPYSYCLNDPINNIDPTGHAGVRSFITRRQQPIVRTRSQILYQLDSPFQVNTPSRYDAPPYFTSHPEAFSTPGTPPAYNPGKLPEYSKRLPRGHQRIITPTSSSGEFVQLASPPAYEKIPLQTQKKDSLPTHQAEAYRAELLEINGRYRRLQNMVGRLRRSNMFVPEEYRSNLNDLRRERNNIRDLLRE
ncbi:TPA: RHS repeat-associated core domain-containing protein [Pseudomonas putida]|uniref:RHS repeat-associated core domain-containing protein n=1 Tax=Pseudomonas putida TaxID=303 RepID=UPI00110CD8CF|nr:RHS repeat-associated core domain-containing protein [Pseudomonas putida]MDD1994115.1 RHS repeat-associated core domain-containing protein [Pseudomonas putida]HDS0916277.1 RHS repeat-associated core domain-containing protein [Pseudomonas putida]HDS0935757.1 RHS repeat-associated core domain-containing protein [Pseudomonas putida]HDS1785523.1 RHS repeat-associated core domain-containing protein [Pseudomonas putida]HDS3798668.1 RHS repeat-associated core domain-containing protein [Pseudomonas